VNISANGVGSSVGGGQGDDESNDLVSITAADKENNKPCHLQISSNVEQSDGIRKEIPQVMENGN
jgi:hypothetical protein